MLNKLLQKSRNSKFDGGATINSSRQASQQQSQQQQLLSPSFPLNTCSFSSKLSNDSQKTSLIGSTNSASLIASSFASQPSQTSLKAAQNQPTINAKQINNQLPMTSNNTNTYNFSSSSSSENYIFSSASSSSASATAARAITPTSTSSAIPSVPQRIQTSVPVSIGMPLQKTATLSGARSSCDNNNSNLTSPLDSLKTCPAQQANLYTPQPTKLKQFEQPIYSAQRVAVNLNSKVDFIDSQCASSDAITAIRQSSDVSFKKPTASTEPEYQAKIKGLEAKIALLVSELERQTTLSNSALQDNSMFRQKFQDLQNSTSKQQSLVQPQQSLLQTSSFPKKRSDSSCIQYELDSIQAIDIQAENIKLKALIAGSTQEAQTWRQKYELLDKQFESHDEALKSRLSEQFEKEIAALNQELAKYKSTNISGSNNSNKFKKTTTSGIRTSAGGTSALAAATSSNAFKENTNAMSNSTNMSTSMSNFNTNNTRQNNVSEDWHANYCALKEEKDRIERNLRKKIESLEEQNAFLQNESQQTQQANHILSSSRVGASSSQAMQTKQCADATTSNIKELNMYFSKNLELH